MENDGKRERDSDDEIKNLVGRKNGDDVARGVWSAHDESEITHDAIKKSRKNRGDHLDSVHACYGGIAEFFPNGEDAHLACVREAHDGRGSKDAAGGVVDVGDEGPVDAVVVHLFAADDDDDEGKRADYGDRCEGGIFQFGDISYQ